MYAHISASLFTSLTKVECIFKLNTKHLQGTIGVHGVLVWTNPLLSFDEHVSVTGEDKSADVLYVQCVAKPSISQEHTPGWQSTYVPDRYKHPNIEECLRVKIDWLILDILE